VEVLQELSTDSTPEEEDSTSSTMNRTGDVAKYMEGLYYVLSKLNVEFCTYNSSISVRRISSLSLSSTSIYKYALRSVYKALKAFNFHYAVSSLYLPKVIRIAL
jgi:hypothetical protein